ncbi:MAG: DUF3857 domain-containing protein [Bacteroidetes bacterium]|nr:DUF3857 domain-containing protein [Bacteroidota bacterium]
MKRILCHIIFQLLLVTVTYAQKEIPAYGKPNLADLEMKDCDFDPGADAVKLLDVCNMYFDRGTAGFTLFKTMYHRRVRIKILKDKGLSYANLEVPFYASNNDQKITNIDACTYNLDETGKIKVTEVSKNSIFIKRINRQFSKLIIAFPEARVGSVVEYRYKLERDGYNDIKDWSFQDIIPTAYSEYEVQVPGLFMFTVKRNVVGDLQEDEKIIDDVINIGDDAYRFKTIKHKFIMHNLIGIHDEPFMAPAKDYLQRVEFLLSSLNYGNNHVENLRTTWRDVVTSLNKDNDFGQQLEKDIPALESLVQGASSMKTPEDKVKYLLKNISSQMVCTDPEAIFSSGVVNAWDKKAGNSADINFILVNALRKAGIKASPILVSTRDNGLISSTYPTLNQFNAVMAYVSVDGINYVLDASDKYAYYKMPPFRVINTRAFVVTGESGSIVDIIDDNHNYNMLVAIKGNVDEKGLMAAEATINSQDYAKTERLRSFLKNAGEFKKHYFLDVNSGMNFLDFDFKNQEPDSLPFVQKFNFSRQLNSSEGYSYFITNLFADFDKNPFLEDQRNTDIDFGTERHYTIYENFTIPEGFVFEELPKDVSMAMPDHLVDYSRMMATSDNTLNVTININFNSPFYTVNSYADFREFYKKLLASLNEQVVIKKKS